MGRKLRQWAENHAKKSGKKILKTNNGIYIFEKGEKEPDYFKDWDEYASYYASTNDLHELGQYQKRNHHLRKD